MRCHSVPQLAAVVRFAARVAAVGLACSIGFLYLAEASPPAQSPDTGKQIFEQKCAACHSIGGGAKAGPDLQGVAAKRERAWLIRIIVEPDKLIAEKDALTLQLMAEYRNMAMPNLGVSEAEAADVIAYLSGTGPAEVGQASAPAPSGQPARVAAPNLALGRALFTGEVPLQNGGGACAACHGITGLGGLGGGTLGPDLTASATKYGETGLPGVLAGLPFPTMQPIYSGRLLTPDEQGHLAAFIMAAGQRQNANGAFWLVALGLAVMVALLVAMQLTWRRRLVGVRAPLVAEKLSKRALR